MREIGRGGMGTVYLAERGDRQFSRQVAVKVVKRGMDTDEVLRRFRRERQILATLEHPNIARLYDGGVTEDGRPYLVMEYVEGAPIDRYCDERGLDAAGRVALVRAVCHAVAFAHRHHVVHRDIKPCNVLVAADGSVRLLDFGIAKLLAADPSASAPSTRTGLHPLTPEYASPEQLRGGPVTPRTDVYALGLLLYRLLTGRRAYEAPGGRTLEAAEVLATRPEPPSRAARDPRLRRLDAVVLKALEHDPSARYRSAEDLGEELDRFLEGKRTRARLRRRPWSFAALGLLALAALWLPRLGGEGEAVESPASLAVLDLRTSGADSADAYLAAGLTDELTTRLGRLRRVRVKGRRSVAAAMKAARGDPETIGRSLGVRYLLEGALGRHDSLLRLRLRLVSVQDGFQRWAQEFTFPPGGAIRVQDSVVNRVARTLGERLGALELASLVPRLTEHPGAYDRFLRGNYELARRTPAATRRAIEYYRQARELDPGFTAALARRAYAYALLVDWGWGHPEWSHERLVAEALDLTEQALDEDPSSAAAWLARAYVLVQRDPYRHEGALPAFERAVALDSTIPEAWHQYAQTLMVLGRFPQALAAYERVLALEGQLAQTLVATAAIHSRQGRPAEARRWIDSAVGEGGGGATPYALAVRGLLLLENGEPAGAVSDARLALALDSSFTLPARSVLARALLVLGDSGAAVEELERARAGVDAGRPSGTDAFWLAPALAGFGRTAEALELLERAHPRGAQLWFYLESPSFDRLRAHPRFQQVWRDADPR